MKIDTTDFLAKMEGFALQGLKGAFPFIFLSWCSHVSRHSAKLSAASFWITHICPQRGRQAAEFVYIVNVPILSELT